MISTPDYYPLIIASLRATATICLILFLIGVCAFVAEIIEQAQIGDDIDDEGGGK